MLDGLIYCLGLISFSICFERFSEMFFIFDCTASMDLFPYCFNPAVSNSCIKITVMLSYCSHSICLYKEHMCIHMELFMIFQICHSYSILRAYWYRYIILSSLKLDSSRLLHFWYFIWAFRKDIFLNCLGFYAFKHWCYSDVIIRLGYL